MAQISNRELHPDAWRFFENQARNMEGTDLAHLGQYRIPEPNRSGRFIYAEDTLELWDKFIRMWYEPSLNSESMRGKIQYIVQNF